MTGLSEASTVQAAIIDQLSSVEQGWAYIAGAYLNRLSTSPIVEDEVRDALVRLNPVIARQPQRVDEILPKLRALYLSVDEDGLLGTNRAMIDWLRGQVTHRFIGTRKSVPIRLIDFDDLTKNRFVVSDEVTFVGSDARRYDIVLWINGFAVVVGETKSPFQESVSWLNAASDVNEWYETRTPAFFVANVLSFACDGKEFKYGAVRQPPEHWLSWGMTSDPIIEPSLTAAVRAASLLLQPRTLLDIVGTFTFFTRKATSVGALSAKVIPRYPQVEAVDAILERARDPKRNQGLVWHHQGSGKTLLMAFAAAKLRQQASDLNAPTIVVVLDRIDLLDQLTDEFRAVGIVDLTVADSSAKLRQLLTEGRRGVIITTIFRFANAGELTTRSNVVVLVDEAHRTQDGRLGADLKLALPNATRIGLTGTPVSAADRDTWSNFGHPDDPGHVLNHYSVERSIADGATLPVHVETRLVDYHIASADLDRAFAELAEEEDLTDDQQSVLTKRAGTVASLWASPARVHAVAEDIVHHYRSKMAPLGLKAQVVAYDRAMCVAYYEAISSLLGSDEECTVVMSCKTGKDDADPETWQVFDRDRRSEAEVRRRFRDVNDPLKIIIVTAKLLTGFDAPVEGVLYLDKPLRAHTLFQAITRPNRRWTHPYTGQEKLHGLIVDYVGLGKELAAALTPGYRSKASPPVDIESLYVSLATSMTKALERFEGIDRDAGGFAVLQDAQERLNDPVSREEFARDFITTQGLFEFLWPAVELRPYESDYRWLAKIYVSIQPSKVSDRLLWLRLGAKTQALISRHVSSVRIDSRGLEEVVLDVGTVHAIQQMGLNVAKPGSEQTVTAADVLNTIEQRLIHRLERGAHPVYLSLSERLEQLRRMQIVDANESVDFLKRILWLARDVAAADRAEQSNELNEEGLLPDGRLGALTQIFLEYKPDFAPQILESIIEKIDSLVLQTRYTGWQASQPGDREVRRSLRVILKEYSLPVTGELFDRAYAYISANY